MRKEAVEEGIGFITIDGNGVRLGTECIAQALFRDSRTLGRFNMNEYKERHELARLIGVPPGFYKPGTTRRPIYAKRKEISEPVFGQIKQDRGFR